MNLKNFLERMQFDIYKRQIKEERLNDLVEQNKVKIDEEQKIKTFNRLIEDANRRLKAQINMTDLQNQLNEANNMISELEDKLLREKAELVNYRKRKEEETSRMLMYSNEDIAKSLLPIVDNFERAINMDDDNLEDEVSKFLSGFKMIYCNLINTLEKYGVKAIDGANKPFDPTYHQAIMTEKRDGVEPEMVIEVLQKGYLLKDKVIRPAMVKVSE